MRALLASAVAPLALMAAAGPIANQHVRGTVSSMTASSFVVKTATGDVTIATDPKVAYIGAVPASVGDITANTFIGTTNADRNGVNTAMEVHIFPESMRGMAEGDYPWDLSSGGHSSAMTNGTVGHGSAMTNGTVGHSAMTNGTVGSHPMGAGRTITVAYKGGTKTILVPPSASIVKFDKATKSVLTVGSHVLVIGSGGGSNVKAAAVVIGRNGLVPPM